MRRNPPVHPIMPLAEEAYAALMDLARERGFGQELAHGRPTLDDVRMFVEYVHAALVAVPTFPSDVNFALANTMDHLTEVQGWLHAEWTFDQGASAWMDTEEIHYEIGPFEDGEIHFGRLALSLRIGRSPRPSDENYDEPATIQHRHVPRDKWDDMMASGLWTYPLTETGKLRTRKQPIRGSRNQPSRSELRGQWQFIGMLHPGTLPEDATYYLPKPWRTEADAARRKAERQKQIAIRRKRRALTRVRQDFRIGDRVVYTGGDGAIPRDWIGVVTTHEPNVEPQHHYSVRWTAPAGAQHEGLYHQSELIDEAEADDDGGEPR